jgi:hypothetical protein
MITDVVVVKLGLSNPNVMSTQKSSPSLSLLLNIPRIPEGRNCDEWVLTEADEA